MTKTTSTIVSNLSTDIVNAYQTNYFELKSLYTRKELYAISVDTVLTGIDDKHINAIMAKYGKSIKRKSSRLVREFTKTV